MLRGSSRHDGIPNKQSARERDRDRLRERQRQERQQMLPNDEKDINVGAQDLFHAPVKVKPSIEDSTTAQIANTLGSFDSVRHLILDTSTRRDRNLIGIDQGSVPGTPVASRNPSQSLISGHTVAEQGSGKSTQFFHSQQSAGISAQSGSAQESTGRSHHRNLYNSSSSTSSSNNSSSATLNNSSGNNTSGNHTSSSSSTASSDYNSAPVVSNYRGSNSHQKGILSGHNQTTHHSNSSSASSQQNSSTTSSGGGGGGLGNSANSVTANNNSNSITFNNTKDNSSSSNNSNINHNSLNSGYGNSASSNNSSSNNSSSNQSKVRPTGQSFNNSGSNNSISGVPNSVTDANSDGHLTVNSAKTVSNIVPVKKEDCVSGALDDNKTNSKHVSSNRKPALERADSQLEIESMLKEMMDISAPLTAIQTPVKETSAKKFTQRRPSKSEEKIVQSIRESGMADVPSPVQRMDSSGDSSSSYDTESSDSESEDSSSGSQTGGEKNDTTIPKIPPNTNSPTRWNLGSFIRKNDYRGTPTDANTTTAASGGKSPKDVKPGLHQVNAINSETSPGDVPVKPEPVVSSTSLFNNKAQSLSPLETPPAPPTTRKTTRSTAEVKSEPHVPLKPSPTTGPAKGSNSISNPVTKSLSSSSSEDEAEKVKEKPKQKKEVSRPAPVQPPAKSTNNATGAGGKRKRKRSSSSVDRSNTQKPVPVEEVTPENTAAKNAKNSQDRNKSTTIRKLFMFNKNVNSPTRSDTNELGKSPSSGPPNGNNNSNTSGANAAIETESVSVNSGSSKTKSGPAISAVEKVGGGSSSSNRVQAKDSNKKKGKDSSSSGSNSIRNGELEGSSSSLVTKVTEPISKKRDDGGSSAKEKESTSSSSRASHGKKNQKSGSSSGSSSSAAVGKSSSSANTAALLLPPPPPPAAKIKEELLVNKPEKPVQLSALLVKINLSKLKRKPTMMPAPPPPPPLAPPPQVVLKEKESTDIKGGKLKELPPVPSFLATDLVQKRGYQNSSRVGSSSDHHAKDGKETTTTSLTNNPPPGRTPLDVSMCSDIDFRGKKRSKSKKVKSSSPKKPRSKHEPDSHSKLEDDSVCGEVSSNVLGYATCDSVSVSTTRTPPVECEIAQAPDSSLNPPHLPSPIVPPQPIYFSYFEKTDNLEDFYCRSRDQDSYLEEAKRLKHKADGERVSTTQASVYLEAGLYFILTGISMERDQNVGSTAAFTMYKDTLVLIRYIGSRFRTRCTEYSNTMEAKIIVLSMRCQSLLSLKLFKIKMGETKGTVQCLQEHFQRHPTPDMPPIVSSPQLSTPSPHSPTSSPAASSSIHPSPHSHHHNQIMTPIPRTLYTGMQRTCSSTMHLISAHELWDSADHLVEKYRIEDFFIQLDRQFGPLTLHNSLVDLVRYVKHALQVLKASSELS